MRTGQLLVIALIAIGTMACQGRPQALSVQAGSTIAIPLHNSGPAFGVIGYGGSVHTDHQRGTMIFRLDSSSGFELVTRGAASVVPDSATPMSETGLLGLVRLPTRQVLVLVDIPDAAPLGTHSLHVVRRYWDPAQGVEVEVPFSYPGQISILAKQISVDLGGGWVEEIVGTPTPLESYACLFGCSWFDQTSTLPQIAPRPQVRIPLSTEVHAVELVVTYPYSVIDIVGAQHELGGEAINSRGLVWFEDSGGGTLTVSGVATDDSVGIEAIDVLFDLDDGASAILDPGDIGVTVSKATDVNGSPIAGVTAGTRTIF